MENMWHHITEVSLVTGPVWLLMAILIANLSLTLIHGVEEGLGPYWNYMGAIAGVAFPDIAGIPIFFLTLTVPLWIFGFSGISGWLPFYGQVATTSAMFMLGLLVGIRIADAWFSHMRLERRGYRHNPGLKSAYWYLVEGVLLMVVFSPGIRQHPGLFAGGFAITTFFFAVTVPVTRFMGVVIPVLRRTAWMPGTPVPAWVHEIPGNIRSLRGTWRDRA